jgi:hypothetical protein
MDYIKFTLISLYYFSIKNIWKLILTTIIIITSYWGGKFEPIQKENFVVTSTKQQDNFLYLVKDDSDKGYDVLIFDKEQILKDDFLTYEVNNDLNTLMWVLFGITILAILFVIIANCDDYDWDLFRFEEIIKESLILMIKSSGERGMIYYTIFGRLIGESKNSIRSNIILYTFNIRRIKDIFLCPKFITDIEKRNKKLDKILK